MARIRTAPTCPHCGVVIAKAKYRKQLPSEQPIYGDLFECWLYDEHECDEQKEFIRNLPKIE